MVEDQVNIDVVFFSCKLECKLFVAEFTLNNFNFGCWIAVNEFHADDWVFIWHLWKEMAFSINFQDFETSLYLDAKISSYPWELEGVRC